MILKKSLKNGISICISAAALVATTACAHSTRFGVGSGGGGGEPVAGGTSDAGTGAGGGSGSSGGGSSGGGGASGGGTSTASSGSTSSALELADSGAQASGAALYSSGNTFKSVGFDAAGNPVMQAGADMQRNGMAGLPVVGPAARSALNSVSGVADPAGKITVIDTALVGAQGSTSNPAVSANVQGPPLTAAASVGVNGASAVTNGGIAGVNLQSALAASPSVLGASALPGVATSNSLINAQAAGQTVIAGQSPVIDANVLPGGAPTGTAIPGGVPGIVSGTTASVNAAPNLGLGTATVTLPRP